MDVIQLLPDSVANQIAAGEVVEEPASVVKELVENAIDAGAQTIKVLIVDAGKVSIQVIDDGCGMSETDARLCFERHATSKIRKAEDLFALHTMGFRGEALASIASVAQITLQTRKKDDELGTRLTLEGCRVTNQEVVACPVGSNFLVENLFFNIPARRKFLGSSQTLLRHITQTLENIVLVYPGLTFEVYNNGQEMMNLHATSLRQRIIDISGKKIGSQILPVEVNTTVCKIKGFVAKPEASKKKGAQQFFFVNGRYMEHKNFHAAVMKPYERLIPPGERISYFIYMEVPPEDIDVNRSPKKTQIKFENETAIWQILSAAVHDAVGKFSGLSTFDFNTEGMPEIPVYNPAKSAGVTAPKVEFDSNYNPFHNTGGGGGTTGGSGGAGFGGYKPNTATSFGSNANGWEDLYGKIETVKEQAQTPAEQVVDLFPEDNIAAEQEVKSEFDDRSKTHMQYKGCYIMTEVAGGMMVTDQHRAHVRVLYEEYMHSLSQRSAPTQRLIFPDVVQFPASYMTVLPEVLKSLCSLGFDITDIGGGSYSISGMPAGLAGMDPVRLVNELVAAAIDRGSDVADEVNGVLALELAERAATPYGELLSNDDMENLISQLMECESQRYTPNGRTIMSIIHNTEIEHLFN